MTSSPFQYCYQWTVTRVFVAPTDEVERAEIPLPLNAQRQVQRNFERSRGCDVCPLPLFDTSTISELFPPALYPQAVLRHCHVPYLDRKSKSPWCAPWYEPAPPSRRLVAKHVIVCAPGSSPCGTTSIVFNQYRVPEEMTQMMLAFLCAASDGSIERLEPAIKDIARLNRSSYGEVINGVRTPRGGLNAVHLAAKFLHVEALEWLLSHEGVDANLVARGSGATPLHLALLPHAPPQLPRSLKKLVRLENPTRRQRSQRRHELKRQLHTLFEDTGHDRQRTAVDLLLRNGASVEVATLAQTWHVGMTWQRMRGLRVSPMGLIVQRVAGSRDVDNRVMSLLCTLLAAGSTDTSTPLTCCEAPTQLHHCVAAGVTDGRFSGATSCWDLLVRRYVASSARQQSDDHCAFHSGSSLTKGESDAFELLLAMPGCGVDAFYRACAMCAFGGGLGLIENTDRTRAVWLAPSAAAKVAATAATSSAPGPVGVCETVTDPLRRTQAVAEYLQRPFALPLPV